MKNIEQNEILRMAWEGKAFALYVYTPLCGTCQAGLRMLQVAEYLLPENILFKVNIADIQNVVQQYQITSVPALLLFSGEKQLPTHIYKMESAQHLLNQIRRVISS